MAFFPYTPATNLLYGLREAIAMLLEERLDNVFARHQRLAEQRPEPPSIIGGWRCCARSPKDLSPVLTAVLMPPGHDADQFRKVVLDNYNMSLGVRPVEGCRARCSASAISASAMNCTLLGALTGVEMGLSVAAWHSAPCRAASMPRCDVSDAAPAGRIPGASQGRRPLASCSRLPGGVAVPALLLMH